MSSVGIAIHRYSTTANTLLLWKLFLKIVSEDFVAMKCWEFAMQIPCQNTVLTRENIKNVFPRSTFIIIIVVETAKCRFKRKTLSQLSSHTLESHA
jgi:hypothetical protein